MARRPSIARWPSATCSSGSTRWSQRSEPHTGRGGADDHVGRVDDLRAVALPEAHVPGSVQNSPAHDDVPYDRFGFDQRRVLVRGPPYWSSLTCSSQSTSSVSQRDVRHELVRGGAVPVLLARRRPDHVTRVRLEDLAAAGLDQGDARDDVEGLAQAVAVPGSPGAGCEAHGVRAGPGGLLAAVDHVGPRVADEPPGGQRRRHGAARRTGRTRGPIPAAGVLRVLDSMSDSPGLHPQRPPRHPRHQPARPRPVRTLFADDAPARSTLPATSSCTPAAATSPRLGHLLNTTVSLLRTEAGRTPPGQRPDRAHRRTCHPKRGVPYSVGETQCASAPHRPQSLPPHRDR